MTDSNRGTCRVCGGDFQLTANGRIRSHGPREQRCAGGSDLPAAVVALAAATELADDPRPTASDPRPTATEFREAEAVLSGDVANTPQHVLSKSEDIAYRGRTHGVRPDPDGPNPHRAPLPTGATSEQLAEMAARRSGGAAAELALDNDPPIIRGTPIGATSFGPAPVAAPSFIAEFDSYVCTRCDGPIMAGDEIRADGQGGYACAYHAETVYALDNDPPTPPALWGNPPVESGPAESEFSDPGPEAAYAPKPYYPPNTNRRIPADATAGADNAEPRPVAAVTFDSAAPAGPPKVHPDSAPHRVRKGPEKDDFDRWGRYKLPDPRTGETKGRQRVTTFAKMISDQYGLSRWQQRMLLKGAVENPQIVTTARGLDVKVNAATMDTVADALKDLAGDRVAAAKGTEFHKVTEEFDLGHYTHEGQVPEQHRGALANYAVSLSRAGIKVVPAMVERTTMVRSVDVAGTLDRILQLPNGDFVIGDVKTGQDLTYGWLDIGVQLACYAHGVNENGVWDWDSRTWLPAPKVREDYAIVMHVPAGSEICVLYRVDLTVGWANATLAAQVREARKYRRHSQLLALDGPEFVPSPGAAEALEAAQGAVQSFGNAGVPVVTDNGVSYQVPGTSAVDALAGAAALPRLIAPVGSDAYLAADDAAEIENRRQAYQPASATTPLQVQPHTEAYVPTLQPEPTKVPMTPAPESFALRMALITDSSQAAAVYGDAVLAGESALGLADIAQIGTERLSQVETMTREFSFLRNQKDAAWLYQAAVQVLGDTDPLLPVLVRIGTQALENQPS